jgi:hypothetical protein
LPLPLRSGSSKTRAGEVDLSFSADLAVDHLEESGELEGLRDTRLAATGSPARASDGAPASQPMLEK